MMLDKQSKLLRLLSLCIILLAIVIGGLVICTLLLQWRPAAMPQQSSGSPSSSALISSPPAVQTPAVDIAASPSPGSEEELPAISAYQANLLHALYDAFVCQEESNLKAALKNWGIAQFEAIVPTETPWESLNGLSWDGQQLRRDYSGIGLQFAGTSFFYGELTNGVPDGQGICITIDTYYLEDNVIGYVRADGYWENGVMVGSGIVCKCNTGDNPWESEFVFHCTFDGTPEEVMAQGVLCIYYRTEDARHCFEFKIQDGYLASSDLELDRIIDLQVLPCSQHENCSAKLIVDDQMDQLCQNIYPWNRESPYETPFNPPMISFSWMG